MRERPVTGERVGEIGGRSVFQRLPVPRLRKMVEGRSEYVQHGAEKINLKGR